jgi:hypothetical protein
MYPADKLSSATTLQHPTAGGGFVGVGVVRTLAAAATTGYLVVQD